MNEMNSNDVEASMTASQRGFNTSIERQIGEDLIIEKINRIFDEVAQDRQDFEESYMSLGGIPHINKRSGDGSSSEISKLN